MTQTFIEGTTNDKEEEKNLREFKAEWFGRSNEENSMILGHFKNEDRIPMMLNMKPKEKHPRERSNLWWAQQVRKDVTQNEETYKEI
jgi:hypothetical protein